MASLHRPDRSRRVRRALAALPLLALLLIAPARSPAAVAGDLYACTQRAWDDYNTCLVQTSTEWERTGCDVAFSTDYALCWARYFGTIRDLLT